MKPKKSSKVAGSSSLRASASSVWLSDVFQTYREAVSFQGLSPDPAAISESFRERCRRAVLVGRAVANLRREYQRVGFLPIAWSDYMSGLMKAIGQTSSVILAKSGIKDLSEVTLDSVKAMAELAHDIGFSLQETLVQIRIAFAQRADCASIPLLVRRSRSHGSKGFDPGQCEEALAAIEGKLDAKQLSELRRIKAIIREVYSERNLNS